MKVKWFVYLIFTCFFNSGFNQVNEVIEFESANPFSMSDVINMLEEQEKIKVFGKLTLPSNDNLEKLPLIIGVAGSLGWRKHHYEYLKMFQDEGYATFELNSFKSRNITSTVGSQVEVTASAMILDAYRALEKLSNDPRIDKNRVSIIGWSLGGAVSLFSGWLPLKNAIIKNVSFASHLAFYPPCFIDPENTDFTQSPIHILIGELDDWTPADPCDMFVNKLSKKANINLTVYENSHHGFDSEEPIVFNEKGYSFKDCLFRLDENGDVLMNFLSLPMSSPLMQKFGFLFCVERGVNIGGNPEARKKSFEFASSFMSRTLMN